MLYQTWPVFIIGTTVHVLQCKFEQLTSSCVSEQKDQHPSAPYTGTLPAVASVSPANWAPMQV